MKKKFMTDLGALQPPTIAVTIKPLPSGSLCALETSTVHRKGHFECFRSKTKPGGEATTPGKRSFAHTRVWWLFHGADFSTH